jgi:Ni/Co efflux regulator RcnB
MKRLMIGASMLALLAGPVAIAQPDNRGGNRDYGEQRGYDDHRGHGDHGDRRGRRDWRDDGQNHGNQWRDGRWHDQNGRRDNGRHYGWSRDRGHDYNWRRGQRMGYNDWRYAQRIDYRRYSLRQPPRGYEWRRNDDRFLMVAIASGVIATVIMSNGR